MVTITITGTNNAPTVTATPAFANFTEDVDASRAGLRARRHGELRRHGHERHGVDQLGVQQRHRVEVAVSLGAGLITQLTSGTFSASVLAAAAPGSTPWTYTANDVNLDFLAVGETITFSFTVTATDNHSTTDTDVVTVTITGTNDAPTVSATPPSRTSRKMWTPAPRT